MEPLVPPPRWLYAVYVVVWLLALAATLYTLFCAGGFKVAVLAIVPPRLLDAPGSHRHPPGGDPVRAEVGSSRIAMRPVQGRTPAGARKSRRPDRA